jgi:hypothetical protein
MRPETSAISAVPRRKDETDGMRMHKKGGGRFREKVAFHVKAQRVGLIHSTANWEAALIRISGFPLYVSIRPVILTHFPSMSESLGDFDTGCPTESSR